jgi:hypothetical protein
LPVADLPGWQEQTAIVHAAIAAAIKMIVFFIKMVLIISKIGN